MHARIAILAFIPLILEPAAISAGTATQTDWSGGDSIYGPVLDWGDLFYSDTDIECFSDPSVLAIQRTVLSVPIDHTVCGFFNNAWSVHTADINGDGYADIIGAAISDGVSWWENTDGSGTFWTEHTVDESLTGACSVFAVDINGDGYMDILCASYIENDIIWWENTDGSGTSWMEHTVDGDFSSVFSVHYSDINGDGYMDVLGAASSTDDITWWENTDGSGTSWVEHT
ncbi:MAG: VCBS repeat-containing protein, partial [Candidatus Fermentibacteraceae bacterium]|nr:VCBS repeat-containing protein [Candidatus Fermentibacteraceae bacterium]MBN2609676.1 VCBS repeat-containing protein [Candidatus Fermentibacteraceae bacterium]